MTPVNTQTLADEIRTLSAGRDRFIVAIAGPPGSGKSTLSDELASVLGPECAVLPMDGFHLDNDRLRQMDLLDRKGAPETFDAEGFVALLRTVRTQSNASFPTFDRGLDRTLPDTGHIGKATRIILVEGNYLLLRTPVWADLGDLFDLTVGLNVPRKELEARLIQRWLEHGLDPQQARARALGNDMRNVDFVMKNARSPDFIWQSSSVRPATF